MQEFPAKSPYFYIFSPYEFNKCAVALFRKWNREQDWLSAQNLANNDDISLKIYIYSY